jgi:hypothetical protein
MISDTQTINPIQYINLKSVTALRGRFLEMQQSAVVMIDYESAVCGLLKIVPPRDVGVGQ